MPEEEENLFFPDQAEQISNDDIQSIFVKPPLKFSLKYPNETTVLEGERGTGKTIMLRFVELDHNQNFENGDGSTFCIYLPMSRAAFDSLEFYSEKDIKKRFHMVLEYFNVFCISKIFSYIQSSRRFKSLLDKNDYYNIVKHFVHNADKGNYKTSFLDEHRLLQELILSEEPEKFDFHHKVDLTKTTTIVEFLEKINTFLEEKVSFILLIDDFYVIPRNTQKYILGIFTKRSRFVSYKIATINKGIETECHPTGRFEYLNDYNKFNSNLLCTLDYSKPSTILETYFKEMADKQIAHFDKTVESILGKSKSLTEMVKEYCATKLDSSRRTRIKFYGLSNIVAISSGNARYFLKIIREIYTEAVNQGYTLSQSTPIDFKIQNEKIQEKSKQLFDSIGSWHLHQNTPLLEDSKIPISVKMKSLIESISEILRYRLHRTIESNATVLFQINNEARLKPEIKAVLDEGIMQSCIQPITIRKTKDKRSIANLYSINGILAPALSLFPLRRWFQHIPAENMNLIDMNASTSKEFESSLKSFISHSTKNILKDPNQSQTKLSDFIGE